MAQKEPYVADWYCIGSRLEVWWQQYHSLVILCGDKTIIGTSQTLRTTAGLSQDASNHKWPHQCVALGFHRLAVDCFPVISGWYIPGIKHWQHNPNVNVHYYYFIISYMGSNSSVVPCLTKHSSMYSVMGAWLHAVGFQIALIHNWGQQWAAAGMQKEAIARPRL